jgi:hypothetical protein
MNNDQSYKTALLGHVAALSESQCIAIYQSLVDERPVASRVDFSQGSSSFASYHRTDANEAALSGKKLQVDAVSADDAAQRRRAARAARIQSNGMNSLK